jgi:hypothetical protein
MIEGNDANVRGAQPGDAVSHLNHLKTSVCCGPCVNPNDVGCALKARMCFPSCKLLYLRALANFNPQKLLEAIAALCTFLVESKAVHHYFIPMQSQMMILPGHENHGHERQPGSVLCVFRVYSTNGLFITGGQRFQRCCDSGGR